MTPQAPTGPGVYFLFGDAKELLYIGKAANLRRRLADHMRGPKAAHVVDVRWVECADERQASCCEADLIVALAPRMNASMAQDDYVFVRVEDLRRGKVRFEFTERAGTYGAFPHLGKGKASWRAVRTNAGYSALLRLMWVAFGEEKNRFRLPSKLHGSSPPVALDVGFELRYRRALHDFMSGRSDRFLGVLQDAIGSDVPNFMSKPLEDDLVRAEEFYELGPRSLRTLRLRNKLPAGPVDRETFVRLIESEVRDAIGEFTVSAPPSQAKIFGKSLGRSPRLSGPTQRGPG